MERKKESEVKVAFVALIGRPSVGKSSLLNAFIGEKVAIVSPIPQTTRNTIRGIVNRDKGQLIFIDTPGRHRSEKKLNLRLMDLGNRAREESELILYVLDASRDIGREEKDIVDFLAKDQNRTIVAINKIDKNNSDIANVRAFLEENLKEIPQERIVEVSAETKENTEALLSLLFTHAPTGDLLYEKDIYTDQDVLFRISEIIREKAMRGLKEELPHSIYINIEDSEFRDDGHKLWIRAGIMVERESQKGIVVGAGGENIKRIRIASTRELEKIFDWKIELDLRVKTAKDWRQNDNTLRNLLS